jgi:hypothetical protein
MLKIQSFKQPIVLILIKWEFIVLILLIFSKIEHICFFHQYNSIYLTFKYLEFIQYYFFHF